MTTGRLEIGLEASGLMILDEDYTLNYLVKAEEAGFDYVWLGDHFLPWHHSCKPNFFVWPVLAAVAARTNRIKVGVDVTVPIGARYHPAIIAQASATMDQMFPGRFALGVGSGEAMNEARFMSYWPRWQERMDRLVEGIDLIKKLWTADDYFSYNGRYFRMENVFLYTKPKTLIPLYVSAMGEKSAYMAGKHTDMLMTCGTVERCRDVIFARFDEGARSVGKDPGRTAKAVSCNGGLGDASEMIRTIRKYFAGADVKGMFDERDPRKIEAAGQTVSDEQIRKNNYFCDKPEELIEVFDRFRKIGSTQILWSDFSPDPNRMLNEFKTKIVPYFKEQ